MENQMSTAESSALAVSYEIMGTRVDLDLQFVKKYLVRGRADLVSDQEVVIFMNTCKSQNLNPLVQGEVYLIKYDQKENAQMVIGKGKYLSRAQEHPDYLYKQDGITVVRGNEIVQKEGCCLYPGEKLIGGWCRVYFMRRDQERTTFKEVSFEEYNKGMANWKSKPATMINKVAVCQCVREAFPKDYEGLYSEEEMIASGAIKHGFDEPDQDFPKEAPKSVVDEDQPITDEQRKALFNIVHREFGKEQGNEILKNLLEKVHCTSTQNMPISIYNLVMQDLMDAVDDHREGMKAAEALAAQTGKGEQAQAPGGKGRKEKEQ